MDTTSTSSSETVGTTQLTQPLRYRLRLLGEGTLKLSFSEPVVLTEVGGKIYPPTVSGRISLAFNGNYTDYTGMHYAFYLAFCETLAAAMDDPETATELCVSKVTPTSNFSVTIEFSEAANANKVRSTVVAAMRKSLAGKRELVQVGIDGCSIPQV